jgi:hypothetical protein
MAGHGGGPGVGAQQRGEDPDQRGLARAVRPEEGEDLARRDREVDFVEDFLLAVGLAQPAVFTVYGIRE